MFFAALTARASNLLHVISRNGAFLVSGLGLDVVMILLYILYIHTYIYIYIYVEEKEH